MWVQVHVLANLNFTTVFVSSFFFVLGFATTHPIPTPLTPTPLYTLVQINEFHEKIIKNCQN